jgi:hypothetical protein
MLDIIAVARCHRCNVISTPIHPVRSDPTHASASIPFDWMGVRIYKDGDEDFILCPECAREAWEWMSSTVARKSSSDGKCLATMFNHKERAIDFCDLPKGHTEPHALRVYPEPTCMDVFWTPTGRTACLKPKGHDGVHGMEA